MVLSLAKRISRILLLHLLLLHLLLLHLLLLLLLKEGLLLQKLLLLLLSQHHLLLFVLHLLLLSKRVYASKPRIGILVRVRKRLEATKKVNNIVLI